MPASGETATLGWWTLRGTAVTIGREGATETALFVAMTGTTVAADGAAAPTERKGADEGVVCGTRPEGLGTVTGGATY